VVAPLLLQTKQKLSSATPFAVWQPEGHRGKLHEMQSSNPTEKTKQWDFFIAHVSEDKEEIARPLAERLNSRGLMAWYIDYSLKQDSNLRESIDYGLARSRYGIVIISSHFLEKRWPQEELDDLATREVNGRKVILPVWHGIGFREIHEYSPVLADRAAISTDRGLDYVVQRMLKAAE
jgi:TIR domain